MAIAKTIASGEEKGGSDHRPSHPVGDTFEFTTKGGTHIICGRPQGVLKLRLRDILPKEMLADTEMLTLASACLSIRSVDGSPLWLKNYNHFEAFLNRFADDDEVDEFMNLYNRLVNPVVMEAVDAAVREAEEKGIHDPDAIKEFIAERVLAVSREQKERVRD